MIEPTNFPFASLRHITSVTLPTLLVTDCSSSPSPSTSPLARVTPPTLQLQDDWGVAEVLYLYDHAVQASGEDLPSAESHRSAVVEGPTISITSRVSEEKTSQPGKAAIKSSKQLKGASRRTGSRGRQADILAVEAKLKVGLESMGW